jgi:hypothetical protein
MSQLGWVIVENITIYALAGACFLTLDSWWKLLGLAFLAMANLWGGKKPKMQAATDSSTAAGGEA